MRTHWRWVQAKGTEKGLEVIKTILVFLAFLISFVPSVAKKLFRLVRVRLNEVKPNYAGLIMRWVEKRDLTC
jgi:hypothetical protein